MLTGGQERMNNTGQHSIVLIPGDGIGPEVTAATVRVLEASGFEAAWETYAAGAEALSLHGTPLPDQLLSAIQRTKIALKGPVTTPVGEGFTSVNVALRKALDLYANQRPVRNLPGVTARFDGVDLVVVRENTEDLYSGLEHEVVPGVVESLKIITERASLRIARNAFEYAKRYGRKRITAVHKANIMKLSDGLFLKCFRRVAAEHPDIQADDLIVDNACMQLVLDPLQFDVLLMENLYGDILSDLAAGLVGGIGVVPGANIGDECAVFETVHGSAPQLAGRNLANPTAMIQTAVLMLRHLGEDEIADRVFNALLETLQAGIKTPDIGGTASTTAFTEAIVQRIEG